MDIENNKTLAEWNKLLERLQAGEVGRDDVALFVSGAAIMSQALYQSAIVAEVEWRLQLRQLNERQTELMRRQAVALEKIADALIKALEVDK